MLNTELEKFKKTYSEFVIEVAKLHNVHLSFITNIGRETGFKLRKHIKQIIKLQKELQRSSLEAFTEHRANNKKRREFSAKQRLMVLEKIREGKITYKKKKNGNNNSDTN